MKEKTPIYRKIIKDIQDKVEDGTYQSGQKLPSERELCKQYQVARGTLKAALSQLKQAGLLEQARGSGTFVREKGKEQSCYQNAKKLVDELYAMHLTEEEILRLASEILLGQMDN